MKVGDYVRYKKQFDAQFISIAKIERIFEPDDFVICTTYDLDNHDVTRDDNIIKSSPNIIDLIEVGDYVNGHKVEYIDDCKGAMREFYFFDEYETGQCGHYFEEIESIVTKEQFEEMEYKL